VRQVGCLQELNRDTPSTKHKILLNQRLFQSVTHYGNIIVSGGFI